jgi:hypothetical protein
MDPEVTLYFSDNCFGTADGLSFDGRLLRVWDLKTGVSKPHEEQLKIYAALFCLEYGVSPEDIDMDLRIYQHGEYDAIETSPDEIVFIMRRIVESDRVLEDMKHVQ